MTNQIELDNNEPAVFNTVAPLVTAIIKQAVGPTLLERIFVMAQRYCKEGNFRQASEMYWTMVTDHSETPQAEAAKAELLLLAEGYERAGNKHMARGMYERLMDLED